MNAAAGMHSGQHVTGQRGNSASPHRDASDEGGESRHSAGSGGSDHDRSLSVVRNPFVLDDEDGLDAAGNDGDAAAGNAALTREALHKNVRLTLGGAAAGWAGRTAASSMQMPQSARGAGLRSNASFSV